MINFGGVVGCSVGALNAAQLARVSIGDRCSPGASATAASASANRPTRLSARSIRASDRRKPWVTMTWIRDWVSR